MRDFETVETALLAAETGHLVFSTLHTLDATETINRIIAVFPPHQQRQVRIQLASVLKAVISQRLMPRADGLGRVPAVEVMISTPFIRDCIVDKDETHQIHGAIAAGTSQYGMQTFDQSIFGLYQQGLVTLDEALRWASNVDEFKLKVQGIAHDRRDGARRDGARAAAGRPRSPRRHPASVAERARSAYLDGAPPARPARELSESRNAAPGCAPANIPDDEIDAAIARLRRDRRARRRARGARASRAPRSTVKGRGRLRVQRELAGEGHRARHRPRAALAEVFGDTDERIARRQGAREAPARPRRASPTAPSPRGSTST